MVIVVVMVGILNRCAVCDVFVGMCALGTATRISVVFGGMGGLGTATRIPVIWAGLI